MRKRMAMLIAGVMLLVGCGVGGEPAAPAAVRWDPCGISPESRSEAGLDPTFVEPGWGEGIDVPDWSICIYRGPAIRPTYFYNVKSSDLHTIDEARAGTSTVGGSEIQIEGREAYRYQTRTSKSITDCNIAVDVPPGVVVFTLNSMGTDPIGGEPCVLVSEHTADLAPLLPPAEK